MRSPWTVLAFVGLLGLPAISLLAAVASVESEAPPPRAAAAPRSNRPLEAASPVDKELLEAGRAAADRPDDAKAQTKLALALEQKAREVGNAAYHRMAERAARKALEREPGNDLARAALAVALLGEHRFQDSLDYVRSLGGRTVWRLSCEEDALYELGRYDEAVSRAQDLADLKPGVESYPRIALLREVHGDPEGALAMWDLALSANASGTQSFAWASSQKGDLDLRLGRFDEAAACYEAALEAFPGYYMPRIGLARCAVAKGKLLEAEALLETLIEAHGDIPTAALLGDVKLARGKTAEAETVFERALDDESRSAASGIADRRALALFLADHGRDLERAVSVAREELAARPTVFSEDALAWALLRSGKVEEAREHVARAARLGTRNPSFRLHQGATLIALGERTHGLALVREALATGLRAEPCAAALARALLAGEGIVQSDGARSP